MKALKERNTNVESSPSAFQLGSANLLRFTFSFLFTVIATTSIFSQTQPLSAHDSAMVVEHLESYETKLSQGNTKEASRFLNETAFIYWEHNQYRRAIEYYEMSSILNEKIENENGLAMLNNNLGMLYADVKEYEKSYDHFQKTLAARRSKKEKIGIISALVNISVVLNNLDRYDESVAGLEEALALAREMKDVVQMRSSYGMLSETYEKAGNTEKSLYYFDLYRTFHEMIQRDEVAILQQDLQEEQLVSEFERHKSENSEQELEKKRTDIRLLKNENEAYDLRIYAYDSMASVYLGFATKKWTYS